MALWAQIFWVGRYPSLGPIVGHYASWVPGLRGSPSQPGKKGRNQGGVLAVPLLALVFPHPRIKGFALGPEA